MILINVTRTIIRHRTFTKQIPLLATQSTLLGTHPAPFRQASRLHPELSNPLLISGTPYTPDHLTNVTPRILSRLGLNLHTQKHHPLNLILKRITTFFNANFTKRGNPTFPIFDSISPIVTTEQNFDSLLVPEDHISRSDKDTYYINERHLLRAHTSAHQSDLIRMGYDEFLVAGDVYRRDEIDATHYPVFHQLEGVKLFTQAELYGDAPRSLYEQTSRTDHKQDMLTQETSDRVVQHLKLTLTNLSRHLFGPDTETRWVDCYFPFTHPSYELEIKYRGEWLEVLGCGVVEQKIIDNAGARGRVGWAFGLGLERLAMILYQIPDIRVFWSTDPGVTQQFVVEDPNTPITYKVVSQYPVCKCDMSFWLANPETFSSNDFYDLVRDVTGDFVERVEHVDEFKHPRTERVSHCYRLYYRHMTKTFTQEEVNILHEKVANAARETLNVEIR